MEKNENITDEMYKQIVDKIGPTVVKFEVNAANLNPLVELSGVAPAIHAALLTLVTQFAEIQHISVEEQLNLMQATVSKRNAGNEVRREILSRLFSKDFNLFK